MYKIEQITDDGKQKRTMVLPDGTQIEMVIRFAPMQFGWFITSITYGTFVLNGLRVSISPNMLRQFKNIIPFGLMCTSKDNREPSQQKDFSSGTSEMFVLTSDEVQEYEDSLSA